VEDRAKLRVWEVGRLPHNPWNLGYTLEQLDHNRPLRSISISMVGFGSRLTLTPSLEMVTPRTSQIGRYRELVSLVHLPEVLWVFL